MTIFERIMKRSVRDDATGCLRWTGSHNHKGYGYIRIDGRLVSVHRAVYEQTHGPIPVGYEIDHVHARGCRYRDCVNPAHLEAVTHAENHRRRVIEPVTHCVWGHEYSEENTHIETNGTRKCKACHKSPTDCEVCGATITFRHLARHRRVAHKTVGRAA